MRVVRQHVVSQKDDAGPVDGRPIANPSPEVEFLQHGERRAAVCVWLEEPPCHLRGQAAVLEHEVVQGGVVQGEVVVGVVENGSQAFHAPRAVHALLPRSPPLDHHRGRDALLGELDRGEHAACALEAQRRPRRKCVHGERVGRGRELADVHHEAVGVHDQPALALGAPDDLSGVHRPPNREQHVAAKVQHLHRPRGRALHRRRPRLVRRPQGLLGDVVFRDDALPLSRGCVRFVVVVGRARSAAVLGGVPEGVHVDASGRSAYFDGGAMVAPVAAAASRSDKAVRTRVSNGRAALALGPRRRHDADASYERTNVRR